MSVYEENIQAFINVLEENLDIVSRYKEDLENFIASLPNDIKQLSIAIDNWCETHREIGDAVDMLLSNGDISSKQKGFTNDIPSPSQEDLKTLVEKTIQNVICRPPKSNPPPQPNP